MDAKHIGVQLQTLLNIPPINKNGDDNNEDSSRRPGLRNSVENEKRSSQVEINGRSVSVLKKEVQNVPKPDIVRETVVSKPEATPPCNGMRTALSSEELTLASTLARPECPGDIKAETDALLEYARGERKGLPISLKLKLLLSVHLIELLSKKSNKFPRAKFFCSYCNYHMDNMNATINHIMGSRHAALEEMRKIEATLSRIPPPSLTHIASLTRFLSDTCLHYAIQESELERRKMYIFHLNQVVKAANLGCTLSLYGSSRTSLGFKDSDINVNISVHDKVEPAGQTKMPGGSNEGDILQKLFLCFQRQPGCIEVKKVVTSKSAKVHFRESDRQCEVVLSMNNNVGVGTANLLSEYCKLNPLVRVLTISLRTWAKCCEIDNQENGYLPPHAYAIMVIYFLQQRSLLPNLHSLQESTKESKTDRSYVLAEEAVQKWTYQPIPPGQYGTLWLDLLRFYALEFDYRDRVISISHENLRRSEKYWNRKISVEDPMIPKSNLSKCMGSNRMCDYIIERFKFSYLYFGVPRTIRGPLYYEITMAKENAMTSQIYHRAIPRQMFEVGQRKQLLPISNPKWDPLTLTEEVKYKKWMGKMEFPAVELESVEVKVFVYTDIDGIERICVLPQDAALLDTILPEWLYHYVFDPSVIQNGQKPPLVCKCCGIEGHLRADCPEEALPVLRPVVNASPPFLRLLSDVIRQNFERETLNDHDIRIRKAIVKDIEEALLPYIPNATFQMFGSTFNGFGVHLSDVDICLTFKDKTAAMFNEHKQGEESNAVIVLRLVQERLKSRGFQDILFIPSAKVPIVKFRHSASGLDGDISCYNILALHNTELLRTYTDLDMRVKIIGCFMKKLTKLCDISDASRGSLSSYAYVLMAIHYFQHTAIPVLPVLQELDRASLPPIEVDGCDVQFYKDLNQLKMIWPHYGKNRQSLGELWLGFLNYYVETFNFEEHVITINQFAPLTRVSKLWMTDSIAIEDPFDRSHNLGAGLSRRMSVHIVKTFHHLRQFFHGSHDLSVLRRHRDWLSYFTDSKLLQNGNPPLDRQCRICHKIGHIARNCGINEKNEGEGKSKSEESSPALKELVEQVQLRLSLCASKNLSSNASESASTESKQSGQNSFQRLGKSDVVFGTDDPILNQIVSPGASLHGTPGVEFAISADKVKKELTVISSDNLGPLRECEQHGFHPGFVNPSVEHTNCYGTGVAILKHGFHPSPSLPFQFVNSPTVPPTTAPPPGFAPLPPVQVVHPNFIHRGVRPPIPFGVSPLGLQNSAHGEIFRDGIRVPYVTAIPVSHVDRISANPVP